MTCNNCGAQLQEGTAFCMNCGSAVEQANGTTASQVNTTSEYQYGQDNGSYTYSQMPNQMAASAYPMKWYKFLIYAGLFLSALVNLKNAFDCMTGAHYGSEKAATAVYAFFRSMKTVDMAVGVLSIGIALFAIFVRFQLAGFKTHAPKLLIVMYALVIVVNVVYYAGVLYALGDDIAMVDTAEFTSTLVGSIFGSVVMISVNNTYFQKRKSLFVN